MIIFGATSKILFFSILAVDLVRSHWREIDVLNFCFQTRSLSIFGGIILPILELFHFIKILKRPALLLYGDPGYIDVLLGAI